MRMRPSRLAASLLSLTLSASVLAQTPADSPSIDSAYPASRADYVIDQTIDGWNLDWQWRFSADAVYLKRDNQAKDVPVITGPETLQINDGNFDFHYGTRLSIGLMEDDYELDVTFLSVEDWRLSQSGFLTHGLDFDGQEEFDGAMPLAQMAVDPAVTPNPNFFSSATFFAPLNFAATTSNENDALDFLQTGAAFQTQYRSSFQDLEANYKQRSQPGRWLRWGFGYRNVQVRENGFAGLSGTFGSVDEDGLGAPTTAGLSSAALTGAGLTFATGGTDDGFVAGDSLVFQSRSRTNNQLNGVQVIAEMLCLESDYFDLGAFGKIGVYHNGATGTISEQYSGSGSNTSTYTRSLTDEKSAVSFLGHAGVTGKLYLRRNIRVTASYEAIYLAGLALAPDQVQAISTPVAGAAALDLRTNGEMLIHGGRVGLEILFP